MHSEIQVNDDRNLLSPKTELDRDKMDNAILGSPRAVSDHLKSTKEMIT